ncbi:penicillin-binding transpeptidase domain-containing protein [Propionibacteriaceae bacterium G57]|uniref:penicillin-binding transpeptidase domain-containing protein n=1 Tax=Aestuariimicrobium sp. G57 TaxID=3418485 RepID=UPI003DA74585
MPHTRTIRRWVAVATASVVLLTGCSKIGLTTPQPTPTAGGSATRATPPNGEPAADDTVTKLAQALQTGNLSQLPLVGDPTTITKAVADDYAVIMSGMDGFKPKVVTEPVAYEGNGVAGVALQQTYTFDKSVWKFTTTARLNLVGGQWRVAWKPDIVHEQVTSTTRMRHTRELPERAPILGAQGKAIMESRDLFQVGIDKQNLLQAQWAASAKRVAELMKIDVAAYQKQVASAGARAFVIAKTVRRSELPEAVREVPGAITVTVPGTVGVSAGFAQSLLGAVGKATKQQAKDSAGAIAVGEPIGLTGLQKRYDAQLRGTVGHLVMLVQRRDAPAPKAGEPPFVPLTLHALDPVEGKPVQTSLNTDWQHRAQSALAGQKGVAALVAINTETGEVIASAESPAANGQALATFGRYAPGSTFKIVTALALVRKGLSAQTMVDCPATTTVNGRVFKNYDDYPANKLGRITLGEAFANSCNTAFMLQAKQLGQGDLTAAAAALGVGVDFDAGFPVFYGSVPGTTDPVVAAANSIGQGQVETSPLAVAALGASVASGRTVVPWLVSGHQPKPAAAPLTANEASQLQAMMKLTVSAGAATSLRGVVDGAKTGTAEYGAGNPPKTNAWMVVYKGKMAVAVFVADGASGSQAAGPVVKAFLA